MYLEGDGVRKNSIKGFELLRKAVRKNDSKSQFNLALCYQDGDGTKRSIAKAKRYFALAAKQNHRRPAKALQKLKTLD